MRDPSLIAALVLLVVAMPLRFRAMFRRRALEKGERRHAWTSLAMFLSIAGIYAGTAGSLLAGLARPSWAATPAGLGLYAAGLWLRWYGIRTLGAYFSPYIEIRERQPLIQIGPFRYMRHPNYAGLLLEGFALPLAFQAHAVLCFAAAVFLPVILVRIRLEERALIEKFGDDYRLYRRTVAALVPLRTPAARAGGEAR